MTQQAAVNADVREAADTLDYLWGLALQGWEALPLELRAFFLAVFTISVLMQWLKRALLADKLKRERVKLLWLASLPLGGAISLTGSLLSGDSIHTAYWVIIGLTAGTTAMGVHYVTMKVVVPLLQAVWGRVMLAVRGK